jgi:hypothetical protein
MKELGEELDFRAKKNKDEKVIRTGPYILYCATLIYQIIYSGPETVHFNSSFIYIITYSKRHGEKHSSFPHAVILYIIIIIIII